MRRSKKFIKELGEKERLFVRVHPSVLKAIDSCGEMLDMDRTQVVELALSKLFQETVLVLSKALSEHGVRQHG